jgi:hypothetical protein
MEYNLILRDGIIFVFPTKEQRKEFIDTLKIESNNIEYAKNEVDNLGNVSNLTFHGGVRKR